MTTLFALIVGLSVPHPLVRDRALVAPTVDVQSALSVSLADDWVLTLDGKSDPAVGPESVKLPIRRELRRKGRATLRRTVEVSAALLAAKPRLELGAFAGRQIVKIGGQQVLVSGGKGRGYPLEIESAPLTVGPNLIEIEIEFSDWHGGIKSYGVPRLGPATTRREGLFFLKHRSSADGTLQPYALYLPRGVADIGTDKIRSLPLAIVLHGYSGDETSYLYTSIFSYADRDQVVLAFPHARGKNLYFGKSEDDILDTLDDVKKRVTIDEARVYLMGASMGGAGALSAGYHYPHRFAASVNFMGDSLYTNQKGYIRWHFKTMEEAARYSALLYAENGAYHPHLWIHGKRDRIAPLVQAYWLQKRVKELSKKLGVRFPVDFEIVPDYDHEERLLHDRWEKVFAFIRGKRVADPKRVYLAANSNGLRRDKAGRIRQGQWNRAYWLEMRVKQQGEAYGRIVAERDPKTGRIRVLERDGIESYRVASPRR